MESITTVAQWNRILTDAKLSPKKPFLIISCFMKGCGACFDYEPVRDALVKQWSKSTFAKKFQVQFYRLDILQPELGPAISKAFQVFTVPTILLCDSSTTTVKDHTPALVPSLIKKLNHRKNEKIERWLQNEFYKESRVSDMVAVSGVYEIGNTLSHYKSSSKSLLKKHDVAKEKQKSIIFDFVIHNFDNTFLDEKVLDSWKHFVPVTGNTRNEKLRSIYHHLIQVGISNTN